MRYRNRIVLALASVLIIPLLLDNILLFSFISDREIGQKRDYVEQQVRQLSSTVDYLVDKIQNEFVVLSFRPELRDLKQWYQLSDYRTKIKMFAGFDPFSILSAYYDRAFLVYPDDGLLIDLKNKYVAEIAKSGQGERLMQIIAGGVKQGDAGTLKSAEGPGKVPVTYLLRAIPIQERGTVMYLYIELSDSFFRSMLDDIFLVEHSFVAISDQHGTVLKLRTKDLDMAGRQAESLTVPVAGSLPTGVAKTADGHFLVSWAASGDRNWRYYYGFDFASINTGLMTVLLRYTLLAGLILAVFSFLVMRLSRVIYQPVSDMLGLMGLASRDDGGDEFKDIQSNIRLLIERNEELSRGAGTGARQERAALLAALINGSVDPQGLAPEELARLVPGLRTGPDLVWQVAMGIDKFSASGGGGLSGLLAASGEADLASHLSVAPGVSCEAFALDERRFCLIMSGPAAAGGGAEPGDGLGWLSLADAEAGTVYLGLSEPLASLAGLGNAARQARIALDYRTMLRGQHLTAYGEVIQRKDGYFYPFDIDARLVSFIKQLDLAGMEAQLVQFVDTVRLSGVSFTAARHMYFHLLDSLMRIVRDFDLSWDGLGLDGTGTIWELVETAVELREIETVVRGFAGTLLSRLGSSKESPTVTLANAVKDFIDRNFQDRLLSLDRISDELHYSVSHLSSVFRETFGETIKDYITGLRLEKARDLLVNGDLQISRIGVAVGYDNFGSFVKIFKTYLGETPKGYRLRMRGA